jgi:naringenin degradation protein FdeI
MKFATLPSTGPDGRLVVVSRDLRRAVAADDIAATLLDAVERWDAVSERLADRSAQLEAGTSGGAFDFDPGAALAPLPRAPQWLDGSVFQSHLELMALALHPDKKYEPSDFPWMYQGASDDLRGSRDPIAGYHFDEGIDFEAEFGVITAGVPMRTSAEDALDRIRLLVLINDVSLRAFAGPEVRTGFGFLNAKPSTAFAPVAVTPDELGVAWRDGRVHLPMRVERSGAWFGHPHGREMTFHFGELIARGALTRRLSAGTIVGSGTVSNADRAVGSACIAERRAIEIVDDGAPATAFLGDGEEVSIEVRDDEGNTVFGEIRQRVVVTS